MLPQLMAALNFVDQVDSPPPSSIGFPGSSVDHSPVNQRSLPQSLRNSVGPPPKSFASSGSAGTSTPPPPVPLSGSNVLSSSTSSSVAHAPSSVFGPSQAAQDRAQAAAIADEARKAALSQPGRSAAGAGAAMTANKHANWADGGATDEDDDSYVGSNNAVPTATVATTGSSGPASLSQTTLPPSSKAPSSSSSSKPPVPAATSKAMPELPSDRVGPGLVAAGHEQREASSAKAIEERARQTGTPLVTLEPRAPSPKAGLVGTIPPPKSSSATASVPMQARTASSTSTQAPAPVQRQQQQQQQPSPSPVMMSQFGSMSGHAPFAGAPFNPMMMGSMGYGGMPPWMMGNPAAAFGAPGMYGGGGAVSGAPNSPSVDSGSQLGHSTSRNSMSYDPVRSLLVL